MVEVHVARDLDFPAETVWALLEDFGDMEGESGRVHSDGGAAGALSATASTAALMW